jgi:hypothetical protein
MVDKPFTLNQLLLQLRKKIIVKLMLGVEVKN